MIIIIIKQPVGMPHILRGPIIERRGAPYILKLPADPAFSPISIFLVQKSAVPLQGFVGPHPQKADGFPVPVGHPVPASKLSCQILLVHPVTISGNRIVLQIYHISVLRHFPNPALLPGIVPGIPVHLIAPERRSGSHGKAHPVGLHIFVDFLKGSLHILRGHRILRFKILMKDAYFFAGIIFFLEIQHQIEKKSAVLST